MKIKVGEARRLYGLGWTGARLASRYGATYQSVGKALRKSGVVMRPPRRGSVSPYERCRPGLLRAFRGGMSAMAAGRKYGVPRSVAQRFVSSAGLKPHPRYLPATIRAPLDERILAYSAGMIDGEGHIAVRKRRDGYTSLRLAIYSTDDEVIRWFAKQWRGGKVICTQRPNGWLPMWEWRLSRNIDVVTALVAVEPFLVIKRKRRVAAKMIRVGKAKAGRLLDGNEFPKVGA